MSTASNQDWQVAQTNGVVPTWERAGIAVLMDIRAELRTLNRLLSCPNFTRIPTTLKEIRKNTERRARPRKAPLKKSKSRGSATRHGRAS